MRSPAPHPGIKQYVSVLQGELPADTGVPEEEVNSLLAKCFTEGAKKWLNLWVTEGCGVLSQWQISALPTKNSHPG